MDLKIQGILFPLLLGSLCIQGLLPPSPTCSLPYKRKKKRKVVPGLNYVVVVVQFLFLTSALVGGELSASPSHLTPVPAG
jgi:hypothetical protein